MSLETKHEFGSPDWVGAVHDIVRDMLAGHDLSGVTYSLSEEYTDPPTHLSPDGKSLGWHMEIGDGELRLGIGPRPGSMRQTRVDYAGVVPMALIVFENNPSGMDEVKRLAMALLEAGKLSVKGRPLVEVFPHMDALHDRIARITANRPGPSGSKGN